MSITVICPHCGEIFKVLRDEVTGQIYNMSIKDAIEQKMNVINAISQDIFQGGQCKNE